MAIIIWLLGVLDVFLTKYGLAIGVIVEGNPIMGSLFSYDPNVAVFFSLGVSAIFLVCLHYLQAHSRLAKYAMKGILLLRIVIMMMHINWLVRFRFF